MKTLRSFDLNLLPILQDLLYTHNTTHTARNLGLTQPAISHALGRLRGHFKDDLLVKSGKNLEPTPFALSIVSDLEHVLKQAQDISFKQKSFDPKTSDYKFYLGMPEYMAFYAMPIITDYLKKQAPQCAAFVSNFNRTINFDQIFDNKTGLILGNFSNQNDFPACDLYDETFICLFRKGTRKKALTKKQYLEAQHIRVGMSAFKPSIIDENLASFGKSRHIAISVPYYVLGYHLAQKRPDYILTAPKRLSLSFAKQFNLDWCPYPFSIQPQKIRMIWHPKYESDPAHQWLRTGLREAFL